MSESQDQDTTELDFTSQPGIAGLGRLSYEAQHGLYVHPTLAVTPAGVVLGVLDAWMWARKPKDQPDVKESLRWLEGYEIVADLAETVPATRLVYVADREGDLRALLDAAARRGTPADWLIRSQHNRTTTASRSRWDPCTFSLGIGPARIVSLIRPSLRPPGPLPVSGGQLAHLGDQAALAVARQARPHPRFGLHRHGSFASLASSPTPAGRRDPLSAQPPNRSIV